MHQVLVVVQPFGPHAKGDIVADAGEIDRLLTGEHASRVVPLFSSAGGAPAPMAQAEG